MSVDLSTHFLRISTGFSVTRNWCVRFCLVLHPVKVDDIDFRLLQKAFDEIASRLPVKLVIKKDASEYFERRRAHRYEKLKVEANDAMVKPEKWDYGIAANQVNSKPELRVAA